MYDNIWQAHVVRDAPGQRPLINLDTHMIH
jgi:homoaconitase/3-isopropylmalate dehydratase large subunit